MDLAKIISRPEQIVPALAATTRWEAIAELVGALVRTGNIAAAAEAAVVAAIRQRETSMSTGIGHGIGIPHASSDRVKQVTGALGRSAGGIEFDAVDHQPVQLVVLFVVPKEQFQEHVRTLANIARTLNNQALRAQLETAATASDLFQVIQGAAPR